MGLQLTVEQRRIVEHDEGHARVLAVAGSGKTFTMGHRIAHLVNNKGVDPKKIRVLMFNKLAREQFEERLIDMGFAKSELPKVSTFHSFAYNFIEWMVKYGYTNRKVFWTDDQEEKARILMHKVIGELRSEDSIPRAFDPDGDIDLDEVIKSISLYKGALIPPERAGHKINSNIPIIYERFEERRNEKNGLTFDDYIPFVVDYMEENENIREYWSSRTHYLIVDEYQDVNYGQQRLIEILAGDHAEIMVVGDDDQTIYEWRGARPNYIIRDFQTKFDSKKHAQYQLSYSFRFGPLIAQAAQNSIQRNTDRVKKQLVAFNTNLKSSITISNKGNSETYRDFVREIIRLVREEKVPPSEIWVLGRLHAQLTEMETMLLSMKVPYHVLGADPFYQRPVVGRLLHYLYLGIDFEEPLNQGLIERFMEILNFPNRKIASNSFRSILLKGLNNGQSIAELLKEIIEDDGEALGLRYNHINELEALNNLLASIHQRQDEFGKGVVGNILKEIVKSTGLLVHFDNFYGRGEASYERKGAINGFNVFASRRSENIPDFLDYISNLDTTLGEPSPQLITLSTVHRTKGLEFDYIFIPSCVEGFMPSLIPAKVAIYDKEDLDREQSPSLQIENERRLFYVAITRARKAVYIGTVPMPTNNKGRKPSRFLEEISIDSCESTLLGLTEINNWPKEKVDDWLKRVELHAGKKSLMDNLLTYIENLGNEDLLVKVARLSASTAPEPIKYTVAYQSSEPDEVDIVQEDDNSAWSNVDDY